MSSLDSRRALITYALVSEALDKSNDFLMGLAPIFSAIAEERDGQIFDPKTFAADAEKLFGLTIPQEVADFLAPRLHKDGVLDRPKANVVTYVWRRRQVAAAAKTAISTKIDQIVDELVGFALKFPSVTGKTFTRDELQDGLFEWILRKDRDVRSAMSAMGYQGDGEDISPFLKETIYVAASFIKSIEDRPDDLLTTLGEIANSVVVSEALLGVINPPQESVAGTDLTVYLDAPFALDLIGTSGKEKKSYAEEVVAGLTKFGCTLAIFQHSIDELRDNLRAVISQQTRRFGPTADAMRRNEVDEGFVRRVMNNAETFVRDLGIAIFDPERSRLPPNLSGFFDEVASQRLFQLIYAGYSNEKARDRDIKSVEIVMKRRAGFKTSMVFKSKHLLVTNNELLSGATQRLSAESTQHKEYVSAAMHRRRMSATLWLRFWQRKASLYRSQAASSVVFGRLDYTSRDYLKTPCAPRGS